MPTNIFRGDAAAVAKVYKLTPTAPEAGDVFAVAINGKSVRYTAEAATVADVVDGLVAAIGASTVPEFAEVSAAAVDSDGDGESDYLTVTAATAGQDVTLTTSTEDAGGFTVDVTTLTAGDPGHNEIQRVSIPAATSGGTFTLSFSGQTTAAIAYDAAAADVQSALELLSNVNIGDAVVTGASPTWYVEFEGAYANVNVPALTGDGTSLTGAASLTIDTTTEGHPGQNEIVTITVPSGGFWTLWQGTGDLIDTFSGAGSTSANVQTALDGVFLSGTTFVTRAASGSNYVFTIEYTGDLGNRDILEGSAFALQFAANASTFAESTPATVTQEGSSSGVDEIQTVRINGSPTGGTFTLTFQGQTTAGIAYNATAADLEAALELLSNIDDVTVTLAGSTYTVTFGGTNAATDVAQLTGDASSLSGGAVASITTQAATTAANEVQQIAFSQTPGGGTFTLTWDAGGGGETTGAIAYDASAADVQTALEALTTPAAGDFSVSGADGGPWLVEFQGSYAATDVAAMTGHQLLDRRRHAVARSDRDHPRRGQKLLERSHQLDAWPASPRPAKTLCWKPATRTSSTARGKSIPSRPTTRSNTFATVTEHHFAEGQKVRVKSDDTLPTGLAAATDYYVLNATTFGFQLSATRGGTAMAISDDGTGTHTIAVELNSLQQNNRYTGRIGLPQRNVGGYYEYRPLNLLIGILASGNKTVLNRPGRRQRLAAACASISRIIKSTAPSAAPAAPNSPPIPPA